MAFIDSKGNEVHFGDYVATTIPEARVVTASGEFGAVSTIARIVWLRETPKGVNAVGAYVLLTGKGRIAKVDVAPADSVLVMRSDGSRP
jgi:hypothetical protein